MGRASREKKERRDERKKQKKEEGGKLDIQLARDPTTGNMAGEIEGIPVWFYQNPDLTWTVKVHKWVYDTSVGDLEQTAIPIAVSLATLLGEKLKIIQKLKDEGKLDESKLGQAPKVKKTPSIILPGGF